MIVIISVTTFMLMVPAINAGTALQKNANNFGPYKLTWKTFELCKGPKATNLSYTEAKLRREGEVAVGYFYFTFLALSRIDEIKIVVSTLKDNSKVILWAYNLKEPCKHFLFANIIEKHLKAHNCVVDKGNYTASINLTEITGTFLGQSFFYGSYIIKATVISKKGNILCLTTDLFVEKKEQEKTKQTA